MSGLSTAVNLSSEGPAQVDAQIVDCRLSKVDYRCLLIDERFTQTLRGLFAAGLEGSAGGAFCFGPLAFAFGAGGAGAALASAAGSAAAV